MKTLVLYIFFAVLTTCANIGSQHLFVLAYAGPYHIMASVLVGTAVGLVLKYLLDKKFIFQFQVKDTKQDGTTFLLYAATGASTTLIFWSFELVFHYLFETHFMRYLGAVIGLSIGYCIKYFLDKRFVFVEKTV